MNAYVYTTPEEMVNAFRESTRHIQNSEFAEAEIILRGILRRCPDHGGSLFNLGSVLYSMNHREEGIEFWLAAMNKNPSLFSDSKIANIIILYYKKMNLWFDCLKKSERDIRNPAVAFFHQARYLFSIGSLRDAEAAAVEACRYDATCAEAHWFLALTALFWAGCMPDRRADLIMRARRRFIAAAVSDPAFGQAWTGLSFVSAAPDGVRAISEMGRGLRLDGRQPEAWFELAKLYAFLKADVDNSLECFEKGMVLRPDAFDKYRDLSYDAMFVNLGDHEAIDKFIKGWNVRKENFRNNNNYDALNIRLIFNPGGIDTIGHYLYIDLYAKLRVLGWMPNYNYIVISDDRGIVNKSLLSYYGEYYRHISPGKCAEMLEPIKHALSATVYDVPGYDERWGGSLSRLLVDVQREWERRNLDPLVRLTPDHVERGWDTLERLGVPRGSWFVCAHIRSDGFWERGRTQLLRCADAHTYTQAFQKIVDRGGWVIRMGDPSMPPLPPSPGVIDYALLPEKSDRMDVFLWAGCRFFIGTTSGPLLIAAMFDRPCVHTNWAPLSRNLTFGRNVIQLPKTFFSRDKGRLLTFAEVLDPGGLVGPRETLPMLQSAGVDPIDNTPEQICDAVLEMYDRLEGRLVYGADDERLQAAFRETAARVTPEEARHVNRVAADFLRAYAHLLDDAPPASAVGAGRGAA